MKHAIVVLMLIAVPACDAAGAASWRINRGETPHALTTAADAPDATLPPALSLSHEITLGDLRFQSGGAAAVAFGATGGLAVWDARDVYANGTEQLMASAITLTGALVDPVGQPLPLPASEVLPGGVAISFLTHADTGILVWVDARGNALTARIGTDGQLLDPQPLPLPDSDVSRVSVTCGDHDCLVLWLQLGDLYRRAPMKGARISDSGALLDPVPLDIAAAQTGLSAVWNGSEYWIVTTADSSAPDNSFLRKLQLLPLRASGLGSPITVVDDVFAGSGSIAWNGFQGLLAWNSTVGDYPSTHNEIRYSRIDGNGRLLDGAVGVLIGTAPPPVSFTDSGFPTPWDGRVTWDGMTFIVTWTGPLVSPLSNTERSTLFERVTSAGKRLDGDFPNAGFSLPAPVPAAVVGISEGRTVISYENSVLKAGFGSRMRVMQQVAGRRRSSHP